MEIDVGKTDLLVDLPVWKIVAQEKECQCKDCGQYTKIMIYRYDVIYAGRIFDYSAGGGTFHYSPDGDLVSSTPSDLGHIRCRNKHKDMEEKFDASDQGETWFFDKQKALTKAETLNEELKQ